MEQPKTSKEAIAAIKEIFGIDVTEIKPGVVVMVFDVESKSGVYGRTGTEQETMEDFETLMLLSQSFADCMNAGSDILSDIVQDAHSRSCPHCSEDADAEAEDTDHSEQCTHQGTKTLQ